MSNKHEHPLAKTRQKTHRDLADEVHEGPREEEASLDGALHGGDEALDPPGYRHRHELAEVVDHGSNPLEDQEHTTVGGGGHTVETIRSGTEVDPCGSQSADSESTKRKSELDMKASCGLPASSLLLSPPTLKVSPTNFMT